MSSELAAHRTQHTAAACRCSRRLACRSESPSCDREATVPQRQVSGVEGEIMVIEGVGTTSASQQHACMDSYCELMISASYEAHTALYITLTYLAGMDPRWFLRVRRIKSRVGPLP